MCVDGLLMGGGYVEGCGLRVWAEFPLAEFACISYRKVVIGWYIGYKICTYDKSYVGQVVECLGTLL